MPPQYHHRGSCTSLDANRVVAGLKHVVAFRTACARVLAPNTSSLSAPPARECWRRIEPTSKWTATTGMSFSCAPALVSERGIARSEQGVHDMTQRLKHVVASRTACARVLAPARANVETDSNHWDELLLRASAGVSTRHCTVRTRRARYLTANICRLRGSSTPSLPAPSARERWRHVEPTPNERQPL